MAEEISRLKAEENAKAAQLMILENQIILMTALTYLPEMAAAQSKLQDQALKTFHVMEGMKTNL